MSDSTSNYLTKVCDEFVYYDILVKPSTKEDDNRTQAEKRPVSFDLSAARQILRSALEKFGDGWFNAAVLKVNMLKIDPTFNEHNYGFEKFKAFLDAHDDLLETRHKSPVRLEVRKVIPNDTVPAIASPENLLDKYLACLAKLNLHISPTEHRENLISQLFEIIKGNHNTKISLTEAIEKLADDVEKRTPYIGYTIISETAYQVFHCNCFWFEEETTQSAENKLWDRAVTFRYGINNAEELLAKCDRELLKKIRRGLNQEEKIEAEVAARLLYGKEGNLYKKEYVQNLIADIELQN
ncbi:MAG: OST-HTH/LOTUS domain-containing protein [Desulfobacterales bacterium]